MTRYLAMAVLVSASFLATGAKAFGQFGGGFVPKVNVGTPNFTPPKLPDIKIPTPTVPIPSHLPTNDFAKAMKGFGPLPSRPFLPGLDGLFGQHPHVDVRLPQGVVPKVKDGFGRGDPHLERRIPPSFRPTAGDGSGRGGSDGNGNGRTETGGFQGSVLKFLKPKGSAGFTFR
ncbi:MAG TPA: hypothetical protein VHR66_01490 [Gemmataceae bacterium]|jgi:hypothetical protein|nr:hypothetical protein [Gemmataceae bacterium]